MEERFDYDGLLGVNSDLREQLADAQATVEALQRERDGAVKRSSSYLVNKNAIQKELQRERGFTNRYLKRLHEAEAALDAERARNTQLQALVWCIGRAMRK